MNASYIPSGLIIKDVITFIAAVGDDSHQQVFNFSHRPPYALRIDVSPVSNRPALVAFMDQVVHEHHRELLAAHPWKCKCGLPATTLFHQPMSMLHSEEDPHIRDCVMPFCFEGSRCWDRFQPHMQRMLASMVVPKSCEHSVSDNSDTLVRCGYCAKADVIDGDTLKKCGTCKVIQYCSRECQVADWPNHKKVCKDIAAKNNK